MTKKDAIELNEWLEPQELDPELAEYLETDGIFPCIRHPLVYSVPHVEPMNRHINAVLASKKKAIEEATESKNWSHYIWLHERPYRMMTLIRIRPNMEPGEFWKLLGEVIVDSENIREHQSIYDLLLRKSEREQYHRLMMNEEELEAYDALPDVVTAYRGTQKYEKIPGHSWTTNIGIARWFANRFASPNNHPLVVSAEIPKSHIVALFLRRNEDELIIDRSVFKDGEINIHIEDMH